MKPSDLMKALADETRLRILVLLTVEELCVNEIEKVLRLSQSNVSRHLAKLQATGLITGRRAAHHKYYRLSKELAASWPALHRFLENLKIHPEYGVDLHALEAHREAGRMPDYISKRATTFFEDELI